MATEIKAIQCPKCGSTAKTDLGLDHFRCDSCGTEYFLDNRKTFAGPKPGIIDPRRPVTSPRRASVVIFFLFVILVGVLALFLIYISSTTSSPNNAGFSGNSSSAEPATWQYVYSYAYLSADGRPIIVAIGTLTDNRTSGNLPEPYIFFFDAIKNSLIKRFQIPGRDQSTTSDGWDFKQFSNGDLFVESERKLLYKIDKEGYSIKDVTQTFGAGQPELSSGIAEVQFVYNSGDGFKLLTDDGKELYYFPLIHKVYTQNEYYSAEEGMKGLLSGAVPAIGFTFSANNDVLVRDGVRLVKYRYMNNGGGPQEEETFWYENGKPKAIDHDRSRAISFADFTPGRLYFRPKALYSDSDYVLISYAPTAANTGRLVQCFNARSAAIVFTTPLDDSNLEDGTIRYKDGFVLHYGWVYLIDMKGKLTKLKNGNYYGS